MSEELCTNCRMPVMWKHDLVTVYRHRGGQHFIFEQVPAQVCERCGYRVYPMHAVEEMERLMDKPIDPSTTQSVPVISFDGRDLADVPRQGYDGVEGLLDRNHPQRHVWLNLPSSILLPQVRSMLSHALTPIEFWVRSVKRESNPPIVVDEIAERDFPNFVSQNLKVIRSISDFFLDYGIYHGYNDDNEMLE